MQGPRSTRFPKRSDIRLCIVGRYGVLCRYSTGGAVQADGSWGGGGGGEGRINKLELHIPYIQIMPACAAKPAVPKTGNFCARSH